MARQPCPQCCRSELTYEVVPVLVVELGWYGDDPPEEVRHEAEMIHLSLPLNVVLPQPVTPDTDENNSNFIK